LGAENGKIWITSSDNEVGIHSRDILSHEIINSQMDILNANVDLQQSLSNYDSLGFSSRSRGPIIKTNSESYLIDPNTLNAKPTIEEFANSFNKVSCLSSTISIFKDKICFDNKFQNVLTYIGLFHMGMLIDILDTINFKGPSFLNGRFLKSSFNSSEFDNDIQNNRFEIVTKDSSAFVLSDIDLGKDSKTKISKTKFYQDTSYSVLWSKEINDFPTIINNHRLYNIKAVILDNQLILAYEEKINCFDINSGVVIWKNYQSR